VEGRLAVGESYRNYLIRSKKSLRNYRLENTTEEIGTLRDKRGGLHVFRKLSEGQKTALVNLLACVLRMQ
jgi:hypothetical protein